MHAIFVTQSRTVSARYVLVPTTAVWPPDLLDPRLADDALRLLMAPLV
jgi:hypothetical protein